MQTLLPERSYQIVLFADATEEDSLNKKWRTYLLKECCLMKPLSLMLALIILGPLKLREAEVFSKDTECSSRSARAVHLEVAYTLDTDFCINSVRRFICRRGPVSTFRSDNGTNFVGASRELKESLTALNHGKIQRAFLQEGIEWKFNISFPSRWHLGAPDSLSEECSYLSP